MCSCRPAWPPSLPRSALALSRADPTDDPAADDPASILDDPGHLHDALPLPGRYGSQCASLPPPYFASCCWRKRAAHAYDPSCARRRFGRRMLADDSDPEPLQDPTPDPEPPTEPVDPPTPPEEYGCHIATDFDACCR